MKSTFDFKGKKLKYTSDRIAGTLWVHVNGKIFSVESTSGSGKSRKRQEGMANTNIVAPMPGKVTKILVQHQQKIEKGSPVLVMEAMKMEYTLKAEIAAPVKKINVTVGAQVSLGQVLVEFEEVTK